MQDTAHFLPGWFGKIPALGDFASRRLSPAFIGFWDAWLQRGLEASRASLQDGWLDVYLNGPLWNFTLLPGVCGDSAWAGTLMPSVDKVGRHFPLTIAVELEREAEVLDAVLSAQEWFALLEQASLDCLNVGFDTLQLEERLAAAPFPAQWERHGKEDTHRIDRWWNDPSGAGLLLELPDRQAIRALFQESGLRQQSRMGYGKSLWWSEAATGGAVRLLAFSRMPAPHEFVTLLEDRS